MVDLQNSQQFWVYIFHSMFTLLSEVLSITHNCARYAWLWFTICISFYWETDNCRLRWQILILGEFNPWRLFEKKIEFSEEWIFSMFIQILVETPFQSLNWVKRIFRPEGKLFTHKFLLGGTFGMSLEGAWGCSKFLIA
jgi:hypothetical protein